MKPQLVLVSVVAMICGMVTQGPDSSQASITPATYSMDSAVTAIDRQAAELETLVAYRNRWTYPDTIKSHLRQHGVDPTGMTQDQMLALHDSIHDIAGPTRAGEPIPQVQTVRYNVTQNCPGGTCPIPRPESALGKVMVAPAKVAVKAVEGTAKVAANVVQGTLSKAVDVAQVVLPPYPRLQAANSGYSQTVYYSSNYAVRARRTPVRTILRARPVRSILRGVFCR